jgi:acyl carrier protein
MTSEIDELPAGLKQTFSEVLRIPVDEVNMNSSSKTTRNWDSLRHVELVVAIEEKYDISFSQVEVFALTTARGFRDMLLRKNVDLSKM